MYKPYGPSTILPAKVKQTKKKKFNTNHNIQPAKETSKPKIPSGNECNSISSSGENLQESLKQNESNVPSDGTYKEGPCTSEINEAGIREGDFRPLLSASESVASYGNDVNTEGGKVPEPKKPGIKEILENPFDYCNLIWFALCGVFGGIAALIALAKGPYMGKWVSACLAVLGIYSAYTIRMLAALKKELNELNEVQAKLEEQVGRLTEEVKLYDEQNDRFKEETQQLEQANEEFEQQIQELEQTSIELNAAKEEFEHHNDELHNEKEALTQSVDAMQGNLERLTNQTNELEHQYEQFQQLQDQIQKYAEKNGYDMGVALQKQNEMFEKLEGVMRDNAATLLQQIAADMEFADDEEGMSREEYDKWFNRIPKRFQEMLNSKGITFETFAGDDESIDYEEMSSLIESLLKESQSTV